MQKGAWPTGSTLRDVINASLMFTWKTWRPGCADTAELAASTGTPFAHPGEVSLHGTGFRNGGSRNEHPVVVVVSSYEAVPRLVSATGTTEMEDEERQKKLEAGKAKVWI